MALFLQETTQEQLELVSTETLEEGLQSLYDVQEDMNELNEAILQADFVLHEQSQTLTEEEATSKAANFVKNVVEKIKEFLGKVKDQVIKVFNGIKNWFSKIWTKLTGGEKDEAEVNAAAVAKIEEIAGDVEKLEAKAIQNVDAGKSKEHLISIEKEAATIDKKIEEASKLAKDEKGSTKVLKTSMFSKLKSYFTNPSTRVGKLGGTATKTADSLGRMAYDQKEAMKAKFTGRMILRVTRVATKAAMLVGSLKLIKRHGLIKGGAAAYAGTKAIKAAGNAVNNHYANQ